MAGTMSADPAAIEAERLAVSQASARVVQALDQLAVIHDEHLTATERVDLYRAKDDLGRLYRTLDRRLRAG